MLEPFQLRLADLVLVRGNRWLDFPVKLVTSSQYTHVAGYVGDAQLIEAQGLRKTGYQPVQAYTGVTDVYRYPRMTAKQAEQVVEFVRREVGSRYDYILIGWEALRYVFGLVLPYPKCKRRICSTLWADAYKSAGIDLCPHQNYPSPADIVRSPLLRKVGDF